KKKRSTPPSVALKNLPAVALENKDHDEFINGSPKLNAKATTARNAQFVEEESQNEVIADEAPVPPPNPYIAKANLLIVSLNKASSAAEVKRWQLDNRANIDEVKLNDTAQFERIKKAHVKKVDEVKKKMDENEEAVGA